MSFIPYQIDHTVTGAGKTFGVTKKRITFKFGFANRSALSDGLSGAGCRGSEHEVVFVLSLASGKRNVLVDGKEVHFSQTGQNWDRSFDFPFSIRVPGVGAVRARLISDGAPGARPYDLLINGMSYFNFSRIYELGTSSMRVGQMERGHGYHDDELSAPPEERRAIAQAKLESMRELRARNEAPPPAPAPAPKMERNEGNLISFDDDPAQGVGLPQPSSLTMDTALQSQTFDNPPPPPPAPTGQVYQNYTLNVPPAQASQYPTTSYGVNPYGAPPSTPSTTPSTYSQPPAAAASYAPAPAAPYGQAPAPYSQAPAPYAQAPAPYSQAPQQSYTAPPTLEETQMAFGAPQTQSYSGGAPPAFASPQSQASYGSAPAFAQPPKPTTANAPPQQQAPPNYGGYPSQGAAW